MVMPTDGTVEQHNKGECMIKFSNDSLENLVIAIIKLTDSRGLKVAVRPEDVLQPWVLEQLPIAEGAFSEALGCTSFILPSKSSTEPPTQS